MALTLPVLPLTDGVLLPGMVVPVELDSEAQAAVDAARTAGSAAGGIRSEARVLVVPRLDGKYAAVGTVAILDQVGRLPTGEPGALLRGTDRARVGTGVTGPGAALWVEATLVEPAPVTDKVRELATEYKTVVEAILQARGAWQLIDSVRGINDPGRLADSSGYAPYLSLEQK
ncbi:MAG TPA: LON peptidase substrate-binding domain-containing protein, partial [Mycobacteriales bacterium]|nr:LON peptidase substrate-binding domain-containing protein [Mycobacteriales bacterium]